MRKAGSRNAARTAAWRTTAAKVLLPLARALLRRGFRFPDWTSVLADVLVQAAQEEGAKGIDVIAKRTGLPKRLIARASKSRPADLSLTYAAATRLVGRWMLDPVYSKDGKPRILSVQGEKSFGTLASMAGADPAAALFDLERVGVVEMRGGRVALTSEGYIPRRGELEKLDVLGRDGAEFLRTMLHNVDSPRVTFLQRKTSYDNIGSRSLPTLRRSLREGALTALHAADRQLAAADRDRNRSAPGGRRTRVSFGIYVCEEPVEQESVRRRSRSKRDRR